MLKGIYFSNRPWTDRLAAFLRHQGPFAAANRDRVFAALRHRETGLRVVFNLGGDALMAMLDGQPYLNVYEEPLIGGKRRKPSETRKKVDELFDLDPPKEFFFCALSSGGAGIRFYGEYCFVLSKSAPDDTTQILDRNSYDFLEAPLSTTENAVSVLKGTLVADAEAMLALRCLQRLRDRTHAITAGVVAETILHDEMFAEVHLRLRPELFQNCEEIRTTPEDEAVMNSIWRRRRDGKRITPEEMLWSDRRADIESHLDAANVRRRIVTTSGRSSRWS